MTRRNLLKLAGLGGIAALFPGLTRLAHASGNGYEGPFFITVQAGWGWDPTLFCDPKGAPINELYDAASIQTAGKIRFAPFARNTSFFSEHQDRLCVINGIELAAHQPAAGARHVWTGAVEPGYPSLAALVAAGLGEDRPMAFLGSGGFEATGGVVARSCLSGSGPQDWLALSDGGPDNEPIFSTATEARIAHYRRERIADRIAAAPLPPAARALKAASLAEMSRADVSRWMQAFPAQFSADETRSLVQLILSAFKAGVAVSANLSFSVAAGQYDTWQLENFQDWMNKLDMIFEEIDELGLHDSVVVIGGSSGGRTPMYFEEKMKGDWSVTSMILAGPGIPGNRVIGQTDADLRSMPINPATLAADPKGVHLRPAHIHRAIRKLAGLSGSAIDERFPLAAEDLPLFA